MLNRLIRPWLSALILLAASGLSAAPAPRNVILMVGDGMGPNQVIAGQLTRVGEDGKLRMQTCPVHTTVTNLNATGQITDSAASATAFSSGVKTTNGLLGMDPALTPVRTILEAARDRRMAVGLVTTTQITNATPAAFASHIRSRAMDAKIAEQMLSSDADVLIGGGVEFFLPAGRPNSKRTDNWDLIARAKAKSYDVALSPAEFSKLRGARILALLNVGGLTTKPPEPPLANLASRAIQALASSGRGFFLMVEGGQIDWFGHSNDLPGLINQVLLFDDAVGKALDFAKKDGNTLVVITADHETGGLQIERKGGKEFVGTFTRKGHSDTPVDVFAFGPGAERMRQVKDNTDIPKAIAEMLGVAIGYGAR